MGVETDRKERVALGELRRNPVFAALALSTAATSLGGGAFAAVSFLYYTRSEGLAAGTAARALTVLGLASIVVSLPVDRWLEKADPVATNTALLVAQAAGVLGLALIRPVIPLLTLIGVVAVTSKLKLAARGALIARGVQGGDRTAARAWFRTVSNVGMGAGSAVAGITISLDTPVSYHVTLALVCVLYLLGAWLLWHFGNANHIQPKTGPPSRSERLKSYPNLKGGQNGGRLAILDRRYVTVAAVSGLMGMHYLFIEVGLPVWLTTSPGRALWVVSAALVINTAVVALGQVQLSRPIRSVKTACTATAAAGVCFLLATLVIASLGGRGRIPGALAVLGAVAIYSVGEILQASASWELSFELAPVSQASEYQSVFTSGLTLGTVIAPVVITEILLSFGDQGWIVLGVIMATLGFTHLIFAHYRPITAEPLRAVT